MMLIDYAALRGLAPAAKRIRHGRMVRVCGITFWK
jgi:hypothetical protein